MTAALNAANERANELFRGEKLGYLGIPKGTLIRTYIPHNYDLFKGDSLTD